MAGLPPSPCTAQDNCPVSHRINLRLLYASLLFKGEWWCSVEEYPATAMRDIELTTRQRPEPNFWTKFPSQHPFPERPEDAQVILPPRTDININQTLPHDLTSPTHACTYWSPPRKARVEYVARSHRL